jgi:spore coat polysaccharide biosynthesis predicted glycosyltransferase SpsG
LSSAIDIDFVVAGGARYGMGHIMRSGTLAAAAIARGWRVRAFLAGDRIAASRWNASCPESAIHAWTAWRARTSAPLTLFDHPFAKSRWLDACRRDRTRTIVLDDARTVGRARLTINPALHHLPATFDDEQAESEEDDLASLILRGPRYAVLADVHRRTPHRPLAERDTLLLCLGGADPHQATPRIAPILAAVLSRIPSPITTRRAILGPAFFDPEGRVARALADSGWLVECALEPAAMARRMAEARLAVMGFGTSLCELAWHETPHLSITHHDHDSTWAMLLEERGIGGLLGHAAALDAGFITRRFEQALRDPAWSESSTRLALAAIDGGNGGERILDRLAAIRCEVGGQRAGSSRCRSLPGAKLA